MAEDFGNSVRGLQVQEIKEQPQASAPITGGYPGAATNIPSRPAWNDRAQQREEEEEEKVEETLPEAIPVEDEGTDSVELPFGEILEPDPSMITLKRRHAFLLAFAVLVVTASVWIGLAVGLGNKASSEETNSNFRYPEGFISLRSQRIFDEIEKNVLQRNETFDGMDYSDPRFMALRWISEEDQLNLTVSDSNIRQRYILALLSYQYSLNISNGWLLPEKNECEWSGVLCTNETTGTPGKVSGLKLGEHIK
jgi:hypothetical protein